MRTFEKHNERNTGRKYLIVYKDKTEKTIINQMKDKSNEEWRKTKKLESLLGCYENMKRCIQLFYAVFNTIRKIWYQKFLSIKNYNYIYRSTVKPMLLSNSGTWGLTKKEQNQIDVIHHRQLNNKKIWNNKLYEKYKEEISVTIKRNGNFLNIFYDYH